MYLFKLRSMPDKRKLTYGKSPEDALEIVSMRLTPEEIADIDPTDFVKIQQRQLQEFVHLLG